MFGVGGAELLIILVVALLVLGPEKLPGLARTLGKAMGEFRRVSTEFQRTLNTEAALDETLKDKRKADAAGPAQTARAADKPDGDEPNVEPDAGTGRPRKADEMNRA